jgi:hypothetical protein
VNTDSDFRNTYPVIGFCGIDPRTRPLHWRIHTNPNNAEEFAEEIKFAIASRFLFGGDILVLDNATMHNGAENRYLEDWMWQRYGIFILWLPARSPEWNPQELVWQRLVQALKTYPLNMLRQYSTRAVAYAAHDVLSKMTRANIESMYRHCDVRARDN